MIRPSCRDTFVTKIKHLGHDYHSLILGSYPGAKHCKPGHFVHLQLPHTEVLFRRAFSVASVSPEKQQLEVIFKVVGRITGQMSDLHPGNSVNILGPLGKPFTLPQKSATTVMVAGGVGVPPLMFMAEQMVLRGFDPAKIMFFYGGRSSDDIIGRGRIKKMKVRFFPITEDGSFGRKGLVTEPVEELLQAQQNSQIRLYACGPEGMLKAVNDLGLKYDIPGELSLEAPMPCGIGVCLGCVVPLTKGGHARVCADGPVFQIGEVAL